MPSRTPRVLALSLLSAALAFGTLTAPALASDPDPTAPPADETLTLAQAALETVQELVDGVAPPLQTTGSELTLALRDLALLKNELPPAQRAAAERLLARPTDPGDPYDAYQTSEETPVCSGVVCIHYVTSTGDKVPAADGDSDGVPDYVEFALRTMTHVHNTYVAAGYRPPKSDITAPNNGGNEKTDIYLANVGDQGYYGYCTTDQSLAPNQPQDTWGYCVLDNDYSKNEFGTRHTPKENFKVTAAHEYLHAVQFGYDVSEDGWLMEATATWAEDELYDGINDNRAYLPLGPMRNPHKSLDQFIGGFHYGTWIFFRHLTERFKASQAGLPILVREVWERIDDAPGGIGEYSLEGLKKVLRQHNLPLTEAFARFSAANRMPGRAYSEGKHYPKAPLASLARLGKDHRRTGPLALTLDHLAAGTVRYTPDRSLAGAWRIRLILDMKPRWKDSGAIITIKPRSGAPRTKLVNLNKLGDARPTLNFSRGKTAWVEVTLVNASDDFRCWRGTRFSCQGRPKFDDQVERISARIFKA